MWDFLWSLPVPLSVCQNEWTSAVILASCYRIEVVCMSTGPFILLLLTCMVCSWAIFYIIHPYSARDCNKEEKFTYILILSFVCSWSCWCTCSYCLCLSLLLHLLLNNQVHYVSCCRTSADHLSPYATCWIKRMMFYQKLLLLTNISNVSNYTVAHVLYLDNCAIRNNISNCCS